MKNIDRWYEKIIVTKGVLEVYRYEKLNTKGGGERSGDGEQREENYKNTQRKRRSIIRQLITTNFDSMSKFVTLTFDNDQEHDIKDVRQCNTEFHRFIMRLRKRHQDLKYVAVIEFQDKNDRGAVHYHMICNLPYIKKSELAEIWGNGFVKINAIDKVDNVGAYVIKYMTTDMDDKRLQGLKAYNCSKGLERPIELKSWQNSDTDVMLEIQEMLKNKSPSYVRAYESENAGEIQYFQYNMSRNDGQIVIAGIGKVRCDHYSESF